MNRVKDALRQRKLTIGSWIQIGHPAIAEILASAGFEWLAVDMEHSDIDLATATNIFRAIKGTGCIPLARVRENSTLSIRQVLDQGAQGVIVPLVNNAKEAEKAVSAAKYPPKGVRGFAFTRACDYGCRFDEYVQSANQETIVIVMIESSEAVKNIKEILQVEGVDGILVGPYDLSGSMGLPGKTTDPTVQNALRQVVTACQDAGKSAGLHQVLHDRDAICQIMKDGFSFIALGMDTVFLSDAAGKFLESANIST